MTLVFNEYEELKKETSEESKRVEKELINLRKVIEEINSTCIYTTRFKALELSQTRIDLNTIERNLFLQEDQLKNYQKELGYYKEFLKNYPNEKLLTYKKVYEKDNNFVTHFGINIAMQCPNFLDSDKKTQKEVKTAESTPPRLHPFEIFLIRRAVQYLEEAFDRETYKAVLVDIFAKNQKSGCIKSDDTNSSKPEIHTIVLYIQPKKNEFTEKQQHEENKAKEKQILIIDPTNSTFSKHITSNQVKIFTDIVETTNFIKSEPDLQIYNAPPNSTGPDIQQYRDCTDIAIKLALCFNDLEKPKENIDHKAFRSSLSIKTITNNPVIMPIFWGGYVSKKVPAKIPMSIKIKQTSNKNIREKVNQLFEFINEQFKVYDVLELIEKEKDFKKAIEEFFTTTLSCSYEQSISNLSTIVKNSFVDFVQERQEVLDNIMVIPSTIEAEETKISGDVAGKGET